MVAVDPFQPINHGGAPKDNPLGAEGTSHDVPARSFATGKPLRIRLDTELGYAFRKLDTATRASTGDWTGSMSGCHDHIASR